MSTALAAASKPRPVRIAGAVLAALSIIAGGVTSIAGLDDRADVAMWAGLVTLTAGALTATLIPVLESRVVPVADSVLYLDADRQVVPGPAAVEDDVDPAATPGGPVYTGDDPHRALAPEEAAAQTDTEYTGEHRAP